MTADLDTVAPAEAADAPPELSARAATTPREVWRKARGPLLLGALLLLVAIGYALVNGGARVGHLDPASPAPEGSRALATLLREHGVDVREVATPSGSDDTTVFVPFPELVEQLNPAAFAAAADARELVVVGAWDEALDEMGVEAEVAGDGDGDGDEDVREPRCPHPDAQAAGSARIGGLAYAAPEYATVCYVARGDASFVELAEGSRRVTLLGSGAFLMNEHLDDDGNAALAMRLLSRHRSVEWVYPRALDPTAGGDPQAGGGESLFSLLPHRVLVFVAQLFMVLLFLALWRGRRLGPVVIEPLPVVVRAAEAVEGRARLYEAAHARDQAALALRAGLRDRLVRVLGLAPDASQETMVAAITARTGRDATSVGSLLYGPPPADDESLVRLATELDRLDNEVRAL